MDQLAEFYNNANVADPAGPRIKFLIISRPNHDIDGKFRLLDSTVDFIEFAGDDSSDLISQENNLVIDQRIPEVVPRLNKTSHSLIAEHLKSMQHRTYLWLHLVLREIKDKFPSHATVRQIKL